VALQSGIYGRSSITRTEAEMTHSLITLVAQDRTRGLLEEAERHRAGLDHLVRAARAGDAGAWSTLVDKFTARIRCVARRHRLRAPDVEDVVQTTWLRLLEHIDGVKEPSAVGAWLETTARRESLRIVRSGRLEELVDEEPAAAAAPVDEQRLAAAERRTALATALERLPSRDRALLALLVAEPARSYAEISDWLDMPIGSIGPTRARCLARLRQDPALAGAVAEGA
jgi:RNA polymerase sigma factor (sigma-70 family)